MRLVLYTLAVAAAAFVGARGLVDSVAAGALPGTGAGLRPEGSLSAVVFCVVATLVLLWAAHRLSRLSRVGPVNHRADRTASTTRLPE